MHLRIGEYSTGIGELKKLLFSFGGLRINGKQNRLGKEFDLPQDGAKYPLAHMPACLARLPV